MQPKNVHVRTHTDGPLPPILSACAPCVELCLDNFI